ncbi:hypothetical protein Q6D67_07530 [Haliea sp. E1-2-M8]|uniref:hypothetical protein n=1 Tax=Haliea sp. E1-2-M8 TaxID=3064706 RepID=UPI002727B6C5|nr:hypothetical protein [Haliea sp. E1-2-M8]MDO8861549.1 hypothetical protein [Haliea sp. E1-2-M8]
MAIKFLKSLAIAALGTCLLPFTASGAQASLGLQCALPYTQGHPGNDCVGKHRIRIELTGDSGAAVLQARMLALDSEGNILGTLPVQDGDLAHIKSRVSPSDYRLQPANRGLQISAPVPLLSVTATEGDDVVHAYCSNIPYMRLYQPTGQVSNSGDTVEVLMAATGLDPASLEILVDGMDILDELGINPASELPGSFPGDLGTVVIGGENVTVSDLVVDIASVEQFASNTISFALDGLPAGGHIIYVDGERVQHAPIPGPPGSDQCYIDNMEDLGQFAIFGVDITSPADQEIVSAVPTPVQGAVKHGLPIAAVKLNGAPLDLSSMTFVPGNGMTTADQYEYIIDELLPQTDLRADLDSGNQPLGTLDRGANDMTADALDEQGNRAFDNVIFAVGGVQSPAVSLAAMSASQAAGVFDHNARGELAPAIAEAMELTADSIENSFVVGLTPQAVQTLINQKCPAVGEQFATAVKDAIGPLPQFVTTLNIDPGPCACTANAPVNITQVNIDPTDVSCPVTFVNDKIEVAVTLPDIEVVSTAKDSCGECVLGVGNSTDVDVIANTKIKDLSFSFDITEGQFFGGPVPEPSFSSTTDVTFPKADFDQCTFAALCNFTLNALVTIFTFGQADLGIDTSVDPTQFDNVGDAVGASEPDPIELGDIKVDETKVEEFGQASLSGSLASVEITPQGFLAALSGDFETLTLDPDVEQSPGAVIQQPSAPAMQIANASDATVLLSVDTINQLFASMSASGGLKTQCMSSGTTVNDVLAVNCDDLDGALASGYCHGVRNETDCESIFQGTGLGDAIKQGVCHGVRADDCSTIPVDLELERTTCNGTPPLNITGQDEVLFCSQQNLPPQFLLVDDSATLDAVETAVRLNDLSVSIVVDRGDDGSTGDGNADLPNTPNCFGSDSSVNGDCALYSTCLDLNLKTTSSITSVGEDVKECPAGAPGFVTSVDSFSLLVRQEGVVCGAAQETADDELVGTSREDQTVELIRDNADTFTPPVCIEGLDLGGFVTLQNPSIIAVETDGDTDTQEYIGITGAVAPPTSP